MTLEEFQTYLKRPDTMEEAGEIVDILGSTILSAVKMLPNTEENKEVSLFLSMGFGVAFYRRFKSIMPPEEFFRHLQEMMDSRNAENAQDPA